MKSPNELQLPNMIRPFHYLIAGCLAIVAVSGVARAQSREKIQIESVRIGFPPGPQTQQDDNALSLTRDSLYRMGEWVPVYVTLNNVGRYDPDPKKDGPALLIVESPDSDHTTTAYTVDLPRFDEQDGLAGKARVMTYTRPGSSYGEFTIRIVAKDTGRDLIAPSKPGSAGTTWGNSDALNSSQGLYVAIGTRLPGLHDIFKTTPQDGQAPPRAGSMPVRRYGIGLLTRIGDMPDLWFGYSAVDVVILSTTDREFTTSLINDPVRSAALAEWVRRGGRLIVCGSNADVLSGSANLAALLPVEIGQKYQAPSLNVTWRDGGAMRDPLVSREKNKSLSFIRLLPRQNPHRAFRALVGGPAEPADATPIVVQGPYGLGRVTVVAMDLDQPPFTSWTGHVEFWQTLFESSGPRISRYAGADQISYGPYGQRQFSGNSGEVATLLSQVESFEGVPVISFGWVALFILLYIIVVGPLDYFILKKVFKRLELTWITFPTVVLAVSVAAYFTAYYLKGSDLRVNKQDIIDVDLQTGRVYGRSWFAIFSPQIHKFTIGLEPAAPWVAPVDPDDPTTNVTWFGKPQESTQTLFRHSYDYARQAVGLRGVPIKVWTAKGFQADWAAPISKEKPLIVSGLRHPPGRPDELIGFVTSNLDMPLDDVLLIYRGEVSSIGSLLPGARKAVTAQSRVKFSVLRQDPYALDPELKRPTETVSTAPQIQPGWTRLPLNVLFHEAWIASVEANNGGLRALDQSWRLNDENRDEVILVGRLPQARGATEAVNAGPAVPSRLWLGKLPKDGGPRPEINGTMRQDTIVRVLIPLAPEPRAAAPQ